MRHLPLALALVVAGMGCTADPGPTPPPTAPAPTVTGTLQPTDLPPTASTSPPPSAWPSPTGAPSATPAGLEWTQVPLPAAEGFATVGVVDIAYLDGSFLVVGAGWQEDERGVEVNVPLFWLSRDGRDWELVVPDWPAGYIDALTTWQGRFVAAGYVGDERASAAFWTSGDGRDWERLADRPVLEFLRGATEGRDIVAGGISHLRSEGDELIARGWLYCACGAEILDATVEWRTTDGERWQRAELPAAEDRPPLAGGPGWLRISADADAIEASADGATWQTAWRPAAGPDGNEPSAQLFAIDRHPGGLLAVGALLDGGASTPLAVASVDGVSWTTSSSAAVGDAHGVLVDFAAGNRLIVAVGGAGSPPQPYVWLHQPQSVLQRNGASG